MSRAGKIARRTFLVGSAAVLGGVAFGTYRYLAPPRNPLLDGLPEGAAALTPHVLITGDAVTLITPRADLGQGAYSLQAALIAEELDVDLEQVRVDPGPPSVAYYNGAVAAEGFPFASTDGSVLARGARGFGDVAAKLIGLQVTGGSSTVPDAYLKLRVAGAVARETLKEAAAREAGLDRSALTTASGNVILPDGTRRPYTGLAAAAAGIDPVRNVDLRPPEDWRYVGRAMQRIDIVAKSTGRQVYGIDLRRAEMLYGTVRSNPRIGGGLRGYDASAAENMRGVRKIVPLENGVGVIADNTWRAFQAVEAIDFDWGPAPYPADTEAMWGRLQQALAEENRDSRFKDEGDVEAAFAGAKVLEAEYRVPHLAHAPLEPASAVAQVTADRVDIWTATQIPRFVQRNVAAQTGLAAEDVHLHVQMAGGSFGHRLEDTYVRQAVALAQAAQGTPVKMTWRREEDMAQDYPRPMMLARGRGTVRDGLVEAYDLDIVSPSVTASQLARQGLPTAGPDVTIIAGAWDQPFAIPNVRVTGYRAPEMVPVSSWRSVGASGNGFFHDCFLDELIHAAGADPLAERIRLCWHEPSRKVLEAVGEMSGWNGPHLGEGRGRGVAFCLSFGVPVAEVVDVTATDKGIRIDKVFVAAEVGRVIDPVNFENQVQGGVVWGLGHAMNCAVTHQDGMAVQANFNQYEGMRHYQVPEIVVRGLENGEIVRGIGEPPVPPAAPALANAIFAATGQRIRTLPLWDSVDFA